MLTLRIALCCQVLSPALAALMELLLNPASRMALLFALEACPRHDRVEGHLSFPFVNLPSSPPSAAQKACLWSCTFPPWDQEALRSLEVLARSCCEADS